jgi:hypothetical protein
MMTKRFFAVILGCVLAVVLAGCSSFTPVYGTANGISPLAYSFNFAKPRNRLEQIILGDLASAFPATPTSASPTLTVTATVVNMGGSMSSSITVGRVESSRVTATVAIDTNGQVVNITRFTEAGYQPGALVITDQAALTDAQETAAHSTAESLRAAILATYRPAP